MKKTDLIRCLVFLLLASSPALAKSGTVAITPLGARTGEFCQVDRALLFEDSTGVRILYDAGRTVAGGSDKRLGDVHVVLLTHVHLESSGRCEVDPGSGRELIKLRRRLEDQLDPALLEHRRNRRHQKLAVIVSADVSTFLAAKIAGLRGTSTPGCSVGNEVVVPRSQPCSSNIGFGGKRTVTMAMGAPGVRITAVHAEHGNGLDPGFLVDPEKANLASNGLLAPMGPALGYVLTFTNGLTVYLTGDTAHTSDMTTVVRDYYRPKLVVINIGDIFTTGPEEAAFAVNDLIQPQAVIPEHANEVATRGSSVVPGSKTARFAELVNVPVYLPLSGRTMKFDSDGNCVAGCGSTDRSRTGRHH